MRVVFFRMQMAEQNLQLRRIADALERIAGPVLPALEPLARKSDLSDLRIVNTADQRMLEDLEVALAHVWETVPGSEDFEKKKKTFEDEVRLGSGQEAVDELFWNRVGRQG